MIPHANNIDEA